jgi:phosphocarrier protein
MSHETMIAHRRVEISNGLGLHLRAATKFVELASRFRSEVRVRHENNEVNGRSLLQLIMMAAECGSRLELEAHETDAVAAVAALADLVSARFGEDGDSTAAQPATQPGR